MQEGRSFLRV